MCLFLFQENVPMVEIHQIMCHLYSHFQNLILRKEKLVQIDSNVIKKDKRMKIHLLIAKVFMML